MSDATIMSKMFWNIVIGMLMLATSGCSVAPRIVDTDSKELEATRSFISADKNCNSHDYHMAIANLHKVISIDDPKMTNHNKRRYDLAHRRLIACYQNLGLLDSVEYIRRQMVENDISLSPNVDELAKAESCEGVPFSALYSHISFPKDAVATKLEGIVDLRIYVDSTGQFVDYDVVSESAHYSFTIAAVDAIFKSRWKIFSPTRKSSYYKFHFPVRFRPQ